LEKWVGSADISAEKSIPEGGKGTNSKYGLLELGLKYNYLIYLMLQLP